MKKSSLCLSIAITVVGIICLLIAIFTETAFDGLLWGFTGAFLGIGIASMIKYFYWASPKNAERYKEILEQQDIEVNDELNIIIRDKAGHLAYQFAYIAIVVSIMIFGFLGKAGMLTNHMIFVYYLIGLLVFLFITYVAAFNHFRKKIAG